MSFGYLQFSQKTNEKNWHYYYGTSSRIVFVRFLGKLKTPKRHFEINWPLLNASNEFPDNKQINFTELADPWEKWEGNYGLWKKRGFGKLWFGLKASQSLYTKVCQSCKVLLLFLDSRYFWCKKVFKKLWHSFQEVLSN